MFLAHFGVALAAKKVAPKASLGTLVFAAQFADLLWPVLLLAGVEHVRIVPGVLAASPFDFTSYPVSHSLIAQLGWGAILGIVYFLAAGWPNRAHPCSGSHALGARLDRASPGHADLSRRREIRPGNVAIRAVDIVVEYSLFAAGIAVYVGCTRAKDRMGNVALWSLLGLFAIIYVGSAFGPPPPNVKFLAKSALAIWLTVPWAAWADRHRQSRTEGPGATSH